MLKFTIFVFTICAHIQLNAAPIHFIVDSESFKLFFENDKKPENMLQATYQLIFEEINLIPQISLVPNLRMERFLDSEHATCTFYRLHTPERAKKYIFSKPTDIFLGAKLYQHMSTPPISEQFLDENGHLISVSKFFNDEANTSKLLLISGKSYGYELDRQIANISPHAKVSISAASPSAAFVNMFLKKRIEYIIYYPTVFMQFPEQVKTLRSYPINGVPSYALGRIMCNNTSTTEAFITHVNLALKSLYPTDKFLNAILDFTPIAEHEKIRHLIQTEFIQETLNIVENE